MKRTFRPRVYHRNLGIAGSAFFLAAMVGFSSIFFLEDPAEHGFKGEHSVAIVVGMGIAVFGTMFMLSIYTLAAYFIEFLTFDGSQVRQRTVFFRRELLLDNSAHIKWRTWPVGGSIVVRSPLARIPIDLENFERDERLAIIEHLRDSVPIDQQTGWDEFCHRWALRLLGVDKRQQIVEEEPKENSEHVILTRKRIDRLFLWMTVPTIATLAFIANLNGPRAWIGVIPCVGLWLWLRFSISKKGMRASKPSAVAGGKQFFFTLIVMFGGMGCVGFLKANGINPFWAWVAIFSLAGVGFVFMFRAMSKEDAKRKQKELAGAETADERWRAARDESRAT